MKRLITLWILLIALSACSQETEEVVEEPGILELIQGKDPLVDTVLANREQYRFQFILMEISDLEPYGPLIELHDYSTSDYFYPASMVKLPTALATLEKLTEDSLSIDAWLKINRDQHCGNMKYIEQTEKQRLTFRQMIEELMIVSDNHHYNALYHYVSPQVLNDKMKARSIEKSKIYKPFTGCEMPLNLFTNSSVAIDPNGRKVVQDSARIELEDFAKLYSYDDELLLGSKHEYRREIVDGPYDFNYNLEYPLWDIQKTMLGVFAPQSLAEENQWNIDSTKLEFLQETMLRSPKTLGGDFARKPKDYPDNLYKYIIHGDANPKYKNVKTYSKIGISYGFVTESAYVVDPDSGKKFLLTASIYVNANDTVNDGDYEYDEVARPFLAKFSQLILEELSTSH